MTDAAVFHNLLWPRYKGAVFSALYAQASGQQFALSITHVAETDSQRATLGPVDTACHRYPYRLLFGGAYDAVPPLRLARRLWLEVWRSPAPVLVLPGYHRPEFWAMWLAGLLRGRQLAVFCDSTGFDQVRAGPAAAVKQAFKRLFFSRCGAVFAYGQRSADYLRSCGVDSARIFEPCQAAAVEPGFCSQQAAARRAALHPAGAEPVFLFVGRLAEEKGLDTLLEAFACFRSRAGRGRLVLVGAGPQAQALRLRAQALGLQSQEQTQLQTQPQPQPQSQTQTQAQAQAQPARRPAKAGDDAAAEAVLRWAGPLSGAALAAEFAQASALVLPSLREPWGLVVNEALQHGCPVLVSEVCGCRPELVRDGITGYAFPAGDAEALCQAMQRLLLAMPDAARTAAACQQLVGNYTPARAAAQILRGCLALRAAARRAAA